MSAYYPWESNNTVAEPTDKNFDGQQARKMGAEALLDKILCSVKHNAQYGNTFLLKFDHDYIPDEVLAYLKLKLTELKYTVTIRQETKWFGLFATGKRSIVVGW